jgi:soluble lytic murein transglycosylase-like protein
MYQEELDQINKRRRIAELLMQQGREDIPQQVAGNYVVPTSPLQGINKIASMLMGGYQEGQADKDAMALAEKRKQMLSSLDFNSPDIANQLINADMPEEALQYQIKKSSGQHGGTPGQWYIPPGATAFKDPETGIVGYKTAEGAIIPSRAAMTDYQEAMTNPVLQAKITAGREGQKGVKVTDEQGREMYMPQSSANPQDFTNLMANGLIPVESGGNPNAISPVGASGLTQIMPETAANPGYGVKPMANKTPDEQIRFGSDYLRAMIKANGGDVAKGLAAYNGGMGNVNSGETQNYAEKVLKRIGIIKSQSPAEEAAAKAEAVLPAKQIEEQIKQAIELDTTAKKNQLEINKTKDEKLAGIKYNAEQSNPLIDSAIELLPKSISGGINATANNAMEYLGVSTDRSKAQAQLKIIANDLTSKIPKAPGAQSDIELDYAKKQAGDLGNPNTPWETRMAAAKYLKQRNEKILKGEEVSAPKDDKEARLKALRDKHGL